ncbi:MAG: rRNA pseudouridine synthase [Anaerolineales bacterium]|nr:rRNA pseudouridine synthase [Anaerolineales bacterium]
MPRYLLVNKPLNVLSTFSDPAGRRTLKDFIPVPGVYAAGRLDYDSEGLLLLTDDGALIHRLTDPRYEHPKTYYVQLEGAVTEAAVATLRQGVLLRGERTRPAIVEMMADPDLPPRPVPVRAYHPTSWLKVVLREGKKRQLRRMTAAVGFPTLRLMRVGLGPLNLGSLPPGQWRELLPVEVLALRGRARQRR